jgi:PAS domain S-box-containing protein
MGIGQAPATDRGTDDPDRDFAELQRQKQYYESLLETSPSAVMTVDLQGVVTSWNPAAERLLGYSRDEAIGRDIDELVANRPELRDEANEVSRQARAGDQVHLVTKRTRKDGSFVDVDIVASAITIDGETVGFYAIYSDVTELQRQKQYYASLLEISPTAITTVDVNDTVTSWNAAAEELFGYTRTEAIGKNIDDLLARSPELHAEATAISRTAPEQPVQIITRRMRKDGSLVDVELRVAPLVIGGERLGLFALYHDISELQRQKQYYSSLLELSPTAIVAVDREYRVTSWNEAAERLFGYTAKEAIGQAIDDLVAKDERLRADALHLSRNAQVGQHAQFVRQRTRKDGSLVDVEIHAGAIVVAGERVGDYVIYHDISELQRQKQYYSSLLELSPMAVLAIDLDARITSWNAAAEQVFGYSADEAIGRDIDEVVAPDEEHRAEAVALTQVGLEGKEVNLVTERKRRDGTLVDVEVRAAPIVVSGERVGFYVIYHDISELQRQRRYYEALVKGSPTAIALLDVDGTVTSWNPAAERLFGYHPEEAIGRDIDDLVATDPSIREEALSMTERGIGNEEIHAVTRRTRKDGALVDVELFGAPVMVGTEAVGLYGQYHDISELQRQRRYYEALFELSPTAIATTDREVNVTSWNAAAERLFGYTREEAIGRNLNDLVARTDELRAEGMELDRLADHGEVHRVTRRMRKDGSLVDVDLRAAPMVVAGETIGDFVLYHDISELQRARRDAEAATEAKSAFLATMSHEIRTPMNAVIGMTDLLLRTPLDPEQRNFADVIRTSGEALLSVINDILDFSKIEAGRLDLDVHPFDLRECVESALELVAASAAEKGLDLAYELTAATPEAVIGDATRLRQILLNLLNNAVKFTERGEVVVTVDATPLSEGAPSDGEPGGHYRLQFAVRDTGIGIPDDRIGALFQSFSQVDASTTRRYGGTGLGLAISKRLSERMGGTMWVESEPNAGSTFHFTIEAEAGPRPERRYEGDGERPLAGRRALILDDNATNRHIVRAHLESWGLLTRETERPTQALEWIRAGDPFDVAIVDMQMPEMDGVTVARQLRELVPTERTPVILLSSLGRREAQDEALFAARLTKPIRPSQLYDTLLTVLVGEQMPEPRLRPAAAATQSEHPDLSILVVEDNPLNRQLALLLLGEIGYSADTATNGREALEALDEKTYDVVLMDVQMPEMDGLEATRKIHERMGPRRPRIVAATANATQDERERALAAGMDGYLSKPIRLEELAAALGVQVVPRAAQEQADGRRTAEAKPEPEPIERAVLARLRETLGDDGTRQLIGTFLAEAPTLMDRLRRAAQEGDGERLRIAAHTLKSNAATFGATALSETARIIERTAAEGSTQSADELVTRAHGEYERVRPILEGEGRGRAS